MIHFGNGKLGWYVKSQMIWKMKQPCGDLYIKQLHTYYMHMYRSSLELKDQEKFLLAFFYFCFV